MKFRIMQPSDDEERDVCINPSSEDISGVLNRMSWDDISWAILKIGPEDFLEVSGSKVDGFSVDYSEKGMEFICKEPPQSVDDMIRVLQLYAKHDSSWKTLYEWEDFSGKKEEPKGGCLPVILVMTVLVLYVFLA